MNITTERLMDNVESAIDKVFAGEFPSFMRIMETFPGFDYKNQLLLWRQNPDATCVAGAEAFKVLDRTVKTDAHPIFLLYPRIELSNMEEFKSGNDADARYDLKYVPVCAYDINDTQGSEETYERSHKNISLALENNGFTVKQTKDEKDGPRTLVVDGTLSYDQRRNSLIRQFCTYITDEGRDKDIKDNRVFEGDIETLARELIIYCVQHYFSDGSKSRDTSLMSRLDVLSSLPHDERKRFIRRVSKDISDAIRMLDEAFITFSEMAIVNAFCGCDQLYKNSGKYIEKTLTPILNGIAVIDADIKEAIEGFLDYISVCTPAFLEELVRTVNSHNAYTYPPIFYGIYRQ